MQETIDQLSIGNLQLIQAEQGYRFSIDPVLLARFVAARAGETVVDLGTGSGVLPLLLAKLSEATKLYGIEVQPQAAERAQRNVELNLLAGQIEILAGDVRDIRKLLPVASTDLVVSNPPYRQVGNGRIAPGDERAGARHELAGGLSDFVTAASWLLKNGGRFGLIYLAERLPELLVEMAAAKLEPKRLRMVHPRQREGARMVLVEARKNGRPGLQVEQPLYIYKGVGREYTTEVLEMYREGA
jgi:tRNA1Val (adenine37-N6)-methyltransferase